MRPGLALALFLASPAFCQQKPAERQTADQICIEFQNALGAGSDDLSEKGKQDLDALAKNMDASQRQTAQAKLAAMEAKAATPAAKAEIAKAYTALARQADGKGAVALALKARQLAPDDAEVRNLTEPVLKMARDVPSQTNTSQAVASLQNPQQPMVNNIYVIMVNDSQKGKQLAGKFSKGQVEVRIDKSGRLNDNVVEAAWEGNKLVVNLDSKALEQNNHAPATLAPLVAKALDNGDFKREHGEGIISQVEMAVRGWFSTGKVGDQIMAKGKNPIDTKSSMAGKLVGFFVDLFRGRVTQKDYGEGVSPGEIQGSILNIALKRSTVDCFAAIAEAKVGSKDAASGIRNDPNYYKDLTATKNRLRNEQ
ncbi:MAG: hypothetical protein WC728_06775 [Elusimicrobiota bacterium]